MAATTTFTYETEKATQTVHNSFADTQKVHVRDRKQACWFLILFVIWLDTIFPFLRRKY